MVEKGMDNKKKIEQAAKAFVDAVIYGMNHRPAEFANEQDMAKAAGVPKGSFSEYKNRVKGTQRPNFFTIYKIAYVIANGPPCSLAPENLLFNRLQEALKMDKLKILEKTISLILAGTDMESIAASIDVLYQRLFPPQKISKNS